MKIIITLPILVLSSLMINAQQWSLDKVLDSVVVYNPVVRMYNSEIRSMDEAAKGARSWMPPTVATGFFMTPYNVQLWKKNGEMLGMGSAMLSTEQMFPNKKKLDATENYMKVMSSVEKEKLGADLNNYIQDAKTLYYDWIVLKKKLLIISENEKMLNFMILNAEIRYKNGIDKISAYYKAKAALGTTKNMELMYENDIREKRIRINALMGRNALSPLEINTDYQFKDYSLEVFDGTLFNNNRSDLKAIDREINLAQLKTEIEKKSLKPEFGVKYDHMIGFGGQPMQFSLMLMAKLPIVPWASKMNKANIKSLKWKQEALDAKKAMLINEYSGMAYGMRNELELKKQQLTVYEEKIIPALKNNYKTMQLGYEQNTEELFMLYDAWEKLNMSQLEYFDMLSKALETQVKLDRLLERR